MIVLGADFRVCFVEYLICSSLSVSSSFLIFGEFNGRVLPVLLACLAGEFTGNTCWCWNLRNSNSKGTEVRRGCSLGSPGDMGGGRRETIADDMSQC